MVSQQEEAVLASSAWAVWGCLWGPGGGVGGVGLDSRNKSLDIGRLVRALEQSREEVIGPVLYGETLLKGRITCLSPLLSRPLHSSPF